MTITFVGVEAGNSGVVGVTSLARNVPAGTANGHRMFARVVTQVETATITAPPEWTEVALPVNETDHEGRLYTRVAASEPASYTWTFSAATSAVSAIATFAGVVSFTATNVSDGLTLLAHTTPAILLGPGGGWLYCDFSAQAVLAPGWTPTGAMVERWDQTGGIPLVLNATAAGYTEGPLPAGTYSRTATTADLIAAINTIIALQSAQQVNLTQVQETDEVFGLTELKQVNLTQVQETDEVFGLTATKQITLGGGAPVQETDEVFGLTELKQVNLVQVQETDQAQNVIVELVRTLDTVEETDQGFALTATKQVTLGSTVQENDQVFGLTELKQVNLGGGVPVQENDQLFGLTRVGGYTITDVTTPSTDFGPCAWDAILCCTFPTGSESITGNVVAAATEILWQASGQRYGLCQYKIRPCRRSCDNGEPWSDWWQWTGGMWPRPLLYQGAWFNIACGSCPGNCACTVLEEVELPGPVFQVVEVKVDGVVLPATAYKLYDNRLLVRVDGGRWPICNDLTKADSQPGTWSITFSWGEQVPVIGRQALGELACELVRACQGEDCRIPQNVASLIRQGVTIEYPDSKSWLERLILVSLFIDYANPNRLDGAPAVYDPDAQMWRRET